MSIAAYEDGFDICPVAEKRIFISEFKAYVYAKRVHKKNKRKGDRHAVHCYACPACGHFHLGHMVSGKKTPRPIPARGEDLAA